MNKIKRQCNWNTFFKDCDIDQDMLISVEHFSGTSREVADRARTTIGLGPGEKEVTPAYMRKLYLCEHSPIRIQHYLVKVENIPYSIAMHFVRHHVGTVPFVSTKRDDRIDINQEPTRDRDNIPVIMEIDCNSQALIDISRRRLCKAAHPRTIAIWKEVVNLVSELNPPLGKTMVSDCVYRGWCYEHKSCGHHLKPEYREQLNTYRLNINGSASESPSKGLLKKGDIIQLELTKVLSWTNLESLTAEFVAYVKDCIVIDYNKQLHSIPSKFIKDIKKVGQAC